MVEILKIFNMLDCKAMDTNLKLLSNETSELVGMTQYIQIIGSLIYLMKTRPDICSTMKTLSRYLVKLIRACDEVPKRYDRFGTLLWERS